MPEGAEILTAQYQANRATIWAIVDPEAKKELRTFLVVGTGHLLPPSKVIRYIGTLQQLVFVWHIFEEIHDVIKTREHDSGRKAEVGVQDKEGPQDAV